MGIFRKNITKESNDVVFVGANLPLQVNTYLTIYSIATGISKSKIIANLVTQFKEGISFEKGMENDMSLDELIEQVAVKGSSSFTIEYKKSGFSSTKFFNDMRTELSKKGIDEKTCTKIINKVKNEAKHK